MRLCLVGRNRGRGRGNGQGQWGMGRGQGAGVEVHKQSRCLGLLPTAKATEYREESEYRPHAPHSHRTLLLEGPFTQRGWGTDLWDQGPIPVLICSARLSTPFPGEHR